MHHELWGVIRVETWCCLAKKPAGNKPTCVQEMLRNEPQAGPLLRNQRNMHKYFRHSSRSCWFTFSGTDIPVNSQKREQSDT